jgi:UDP-glucose 4-epimerase
MAYMRILVTGGAGYVGSHAVRELLSQGHQVWVLDNLSRGHRDAVHPGAELVVGNVGDFDLVLNILKNRQIDLVMHFAAFIEVAESIAHPEMYYQNNYLNSLQLLKAMEAANVHRLVFSSTAAIYGVPLKNPVDEMQPRKPINPYGDSKAQTESLIERAAIEFDLGYTIFRYFNVAGAHPDGTIGEDHNPESHLIPRILKSVLNGDGEVSIYGTDYPTRDGTCIRDYVHVMDIVRAHTIGAKLIKPGVGAIYNLGSESGFTVREVIQACQKVTKRNLRIREKPRREGDPAVLVASSTKAQNELKWSPDYKDLDTIVSHAWQWHQNQEARSRS